MTGNAVPGTGQPLDARLRDFASAGHPAEARPLAGAYAEALDAVRRGEQPPPGLPLLDPAELVPPPAPSSWERALDVVVEVAVFFPVAWTWYHVWQVAGSFDEVAPGESLLAAWVDGFGGTETSLAGVALGVAASICLVAALLVVRALLARDRKWRHARQLSAFGQLAGEARVRLASFRPPDPTDELRQLAVGVTRVADDTRTIGASLDGLERVAEAVTSATSALVASAEAVNSGAERCVAELSGSARSMAEASRGTAASTEALVSVTRSLADDQGTSREGVTAVAAAAEAMQASTRVAQDGASAAQQRLQRLVDQLDTASKHQDRLAEGLEESTAQLRATLHLLVEEADTFRSVAYDLRVIRGRLDGDDRVPGRHDAPA